MTEGARLRIRRALIGDVEVPVDLNAHIHQPQAKAMPDENHLHNLATAALYFADVVDDNSYPHMDRGDALLPRWPIWRPIFATARATPLPPKSRVLYVHQLAAAEHVKTARCR